MYVYINSEPLLWTVGFYSPDGEWHSDSDHSERESAVIRVNYLNGGNGATITLLQQILSLIQYATGITKK